MQQVLNSQERNQAFLKFLVFFLVTVVLIIAAIFFNFRLPVRENKMLQSEVDIQRIQDVNQQKFFSVMQDASQLLDSLDKKGSNAQQLNLLINNKLQELSKLQQGNNTLYGKIDLSVINTMTILLQTKLSLQDANGNVNKMSSAQGELEKCQATNLQLQATLASYQKGTTGF